MNVETIGTGLIGALVAINILSAVYCNNLWEWQQHFFGMNQAWIQLVGVIDMTNDLPQVTIVTIKDPSETIGQIRTLNLNGYISPPLLESKQIAKIANTNEPANDAGIKFGRMENGQYAIQGRANLSDRPADAILFTQDDLIFAACLVNNNGVFQEIFKDGGLHEMPKAWTYDAAKERAYLLK
jgi:hypothetical protein